MDMENPEKASPKFPIVINLCAIIITCAILLIIAIIAVVICTGGNHKPIDKNCSSISLSQYISAVR